MPKHSEASLDPQAIESVVPIGSHDLAPDMTALPAQLQTALDRAVEGPGEAALKLAAVRLSDRYRAEAGHATGAAEYLAYAATRMPATFAAASRALAALASALPAFRPATLLDFGAGPGTIGWAALDLFPMLEAVRFVERDAGFAALGRTLAANGPQPIAGAEWIARDLEARVAGLPPADLVTMAYALGELAEATRRRLLLDAWGSTGGALVLVEPGTPAGAARILAARDWLIAAGALIAAPCPHDLSCPLVSGEPWCHFEARLPRSRRHRHLKGGDLGYEDEKFAYLVATRAGPARIDARILFPPRASKIGIDVTLCRSDGTAEKTLISARDKQRHRLARRWRWGDVAGLDPAE